MKNILKILVVAAFVPYIACIQPMGRIIADKIVAPKLSRAILKELTRLNQETKEKTAFSLGGKKATEKLAEDIIDQAKKGLEPCAHKLCMLDDYSLFNKHGVLNLAGEDGHTLLYYVFQNNPGLPGYKGILKQLKDRGAQLNIHDKYVMGPEKVLKTLLNTPIDGSAWTTVKVFRSFVTKNMPEKLQKRVRAGKILGKEAALREKKVAEAQNIYSGIESDLLAKRAIERSQAKKDKYFGFEDLV